MSDELNYLSVVRRIRACEGEVAAQLLLEYFARAQAARIAALERALLHIANPVDWERNNLPQGYELNVPMLLSMIDKPEYYKNVALEVLRAAEKEEGNE